MKTILKIVATTLLVFVGVTNAQAYSGGWLYIDDPNDREVLALGDKSDNTYLVLIGTKVACGKKGARYSTIRRLLNENTHYKQQISWYIQNVCDGAYVRVCITTSEGHECSTYIKKGWVDG